MRQEVQLGSWKWNMHALLMAWIPTFKHGCSLPVHFTWMIIRALHHHCQVGGFQCSLSACYSVSLSCAKLQWNCCIHLPEELLRRWKIPNCLAVWWECSFWEPQYLALFLMTSVVTFFFIFQFTLLLLFAPCIQAPYKQILDWSNAFGLQYPTCGLRVEHSQWSRH